MRGIQLAVHGSFFLLLAYVAYEGWRDGGWPAVGLNVAITLVFFGCVVLHEFGHSFTAMAFGVHVRSILLMPIGGMAQFDSIPREPTRELLITLAGPAVNFVIAAGLWLAVGFPDGWHPFGFDAFPDSTRGFLQLLLHWNILMGCFNLLPVFPMDGGRILRALLATRLSYLRATAWASWIGKVLAASMALLSIFLWNQPLAAVLFVFIFFAGEAEYRSVRRQDLEDLQWHARIERGPLPPRLGEEPPMLGP